MTVHVLTSFPSTGWAVPSSTVSAGRYLLRFARTEADLDRTLRLRHEVYHLEYGIGHGAPGTDRDEDELDQRLHHLIVEDRERQVVVGTYRMQTAEMAMDRGFASGELFDLGTLPEEVRARSVEIGRACLAKDHRNDRVLNLLWRGVASYLAWNEKSVGFGSCGIPALDGGSANALHQHLVKVGAIHSTLRVDPWPETACSGTANPQSDPRVPELFQAYLNLGAKLLGPPANDVAFRTTNWLVLVDVNDLDQSIFPTFFR